MQREQRQLERDADGEEGQGRQHRPLFGNVGQALGDVDQVERTGHEVEQADADDDEGRADGAHDQVLVGRGEGAPVASQRDQHIGRQRGHFEKDEDVEGVAGDRDAEQAGQAQENIA
ncbi:MAG: hypothetical protein R3E40_08060 [Rhodocyclaceae bacterium]